MTKQKPIEITRVVRGVVKQWLGSATSGCHGTWGIYERPNKSTFSPIHVPFDGLGADAEVEVTITVREIKPGKRQAPKCENPWPAHRCPRADQ